MSKMKVKAEVEFEVELDGYDIKQQTSPAQIEYSIVRGLEGYHNPIHGSIHTVKVATLVVETSKKYPPLDKGTKVKTTQSKGNYGWTDGAIQRRLWGVTGVIVDHHDSHGLCYDVKHDDDDSVGCYDPGELKNAGSK